jgi:hypothetical protein
MSLNSVGSNSSSRHSGGGGGGSIASINNTQILTDQQTMNWLVNMVTTDKLSW